MGAVQVDIVEVVVLIIAEEILLGVLLSGTASIGLRF
jgi:hypothetical protein